MSRCLYVLLISNFASLGSLFIIFLSVCFSIFFMSTDLFEQWRMNRARRLFLWAPYKEEESKWRYSWFPRSLSSKNECAYQRCMIHILSRRWTIALGCYFSSMPDHNNVYLWANTTEAVLSTLMEQLSLPQPQSRHWAFLHLKRAPENSPVPATVPQSYFP